MIEIRSTLLLAALALSSTACAADIALVDGDYTLVRFESAGRGVSDPSVTLELDGGEVHITDDGVTTTYSLSRPPVSDWHDEVCSGTGFGAAEWAQLNTEIELDGLSIANPALLPACVKDSELTVDDVLVSGEVMVLMGETAEFLDENPGVGGQPHLKFMPTELVGG